MELVIEAVIAMIWAAAGLAFFGSTSALAAELGSTGASGAVYDISTSVAGHVGGVLAVIGVIVCPITTGDTALRSARMMVQDDRGFDTRDMKTTLAITMVLTALIVLLTLLDFTVLWNYFSWLNQTLACVVLWTATIFIITLGRNRLYSLVTALPAMFMMMVSLTFILSSSSQGFGLDIAVSLTIAAIATAIATTFYIKVIRKDLDDILGTNNGERSDGEI